MTFKKLSKNNICELINKEINIRLIYEYCSYIYSIYIIMIYSDENKTDSGISKTTVLNHFIKCKNQ